MYPNLVLGEDVTQIELANGYVCIHLKNGDTIEVNAETNDDFGAKLVITHYPYYED